MAVLQFTLYMMNGYLESCNCISVHNNIVLFNIKTTFTFEEQHECSLLHWLERTDSTLRLSPKAMNLVFDQDNLSMQCSYVASIFVFNVIILYEVNTKKNKILSVC